MHDTPLRPLSRYPPNPATYLVSSRSSISWGWVIGVLLWPAVGSSLFSSPLVELTTWTEPWRSAGVKLPKVLCFDASGQAFALLAFCTHTVYCIRDHSFYFVKAGFTLLVWWRSLLGDTTTSWAVVGSDPIGVLCGGETKIRRPVTKWNGPESSG